MPPPKSIERSPSRTLFLKAPVGFNPGRNRVGRQGRCRLRMVPTDGRRKCHLSNPSAALGAHRESLGIGMHGNLNLYPAGRRPAAAGSLNWAPSRCRSLGKRSGVILRSP